MIPWNSCCFISKQAGYKLLCSHQKTTIPSPRGPRQYLMNKFVKITEGYEKYLESKYPSVFDIYKTFKTGIKSLFDDTKRQVQMASESFRGRELHTYSRKDLVLYRELPREMFKIVPLLLISVLPGGGFIFPIAYKYPKQLLTSHFWTPQLKTEVLIDKHKDKLKQFSVVLDHLHNQSRHIENTYLLKKFNNILSKLEHSLHPSVMEILEVKPLFEVYPFKVERLSITYTRSIAKCHGFSLRKSMLEKEGMLLLYTDRAMLEEGLDGMADQELEQACFCRGLNSDGLNRGERISYLKTWIELSNNVDERSISLLLHGPVLLAYNHPTNQYLMGGRQSRWKRKHQSA